MQDSIAGAFKEIFSENSLLKALCKTICAKVSGAGFGFSQGVMFLTYALAFWCAILLIVSDSGTRLRINTS